MKKIKILSFLLSLVFLGTSCSMELVPESAMPEREALRTSADCDAWVVGIYSAFKNSALYSGYLTLLPDIQTDMAYAAKNTNTGFYTRFYQWNFNSTSDELISVYNGLYTIVSRCNFFFDYKDQVEANLKSNEKDNFKKRVGEVYFARAMAYADLIRIFCEAYNSENADKENMGICLPDTYQDDMPMVKRSTLRESYLQILSDLKNAEDNLPASRTVADTPYFSQGAVNALRARVCLYMGMGDLKKDPKNEYLKMSVDAATKVIKTGAYTLSDAVNKLYQIDGVTYSDYEVMWKYDASDEIIWKIAMSTNSYGGALGQYLIGYNGATYSPQYHFAESILNLYGDGDFRASVFCAQQGDANGDQIYMITKYPGNTDIDGGETKRWVNMPKPLRLSEVYLVRAEANYWLDKEEDAQKDLASVKRKRIKGFGSVGASGEALLTEIQNERARELFMEGFRLSDLKRWHKDVKRKKQLYATDGANNDELQVKYADRKYRFTTWPIPKHEIEATNGLVVGNASNY